MNRLLALGPQDRPQAQRSTRIHTGLRTGLCQWLRFITERAQGNISKGRGGCRGDAGGVRSQLPRARSRRGHTERAASPGRSCEDPCAKRSRLVRDAAPWVCTGAGHVAPSAWRCGTPHGRQWCGPPSGHEPRRRRASSRQLAAPGAQAPAGGLASGGPRPAAPPLRPVSLKNVGGNRAA